MNLKLILLFIVCCFAKISCVQAQNDFSMAADKTEVDTYVWPKDPKVKENLVTWQGNKFGIIIHMGLYSELGTIESWGLCPEDWVTRDGYDDYYKYATDYRNTKLKFNPVNLDSKKWAKMFKDAGAKYMIFTSKHHEGFCMYDSKYTDFKVTDKSVPYSTNPKSDILKDVLDATRKEGLGVGVYFSKPDWSTQNFWWSYYPPKDRNPTYDITKFPERWKSYVEYTQNQINELTTNYGKIDMLWLDGCWVLPKSSITKRIEEYCKYPYDMDINMKLIAEKARQKQPGMLVVDRWVAGEFENYLTPEQKMPEKALPVPWESCITMGGAWGWVPNDSYKSSKEIVQLLVNIVAKGGNLLLGIGPNGKGEFEPKVYQNLAEVGKWLGANGEAIYETKPIEPYLDGKVAYTAKGDDVIYAIYMPAKEEKELPSEIIVKTKLKGKIKVSLLASNQKLSSKNNGGEIKISIPQSLRTTLVKQEAVVIKISG
ncbi:alpha-L-fucosidase [Flavobacterium sp. ZB4P13]|uniref:alpha-L-fucosidase n=1 Tax=Flavobacterium sp. ZB4P13 TaxID=3401728 RepID=UPI003AABFCA7